MVDKILNIKEHTESVKELHDRFIDEIGKHFPSGRVVINDVATACITVLVSYILQIPAHERQEFTAKMIGILAQTVARESV